MYLYSITTNQAAIISLFRVINQHVGNLPPMPGVFPDYPAPVVRQPDGGLELIMMMRWGDASAAEIRWAARYQHPEYILAGLAGLAETREPMPRTVQQLLDLTRSTFLSDPLPCRRC